MAYPITSPLKRWRSEADPIPSWYKELTTGDPNYSSLRFAPNKVQCVTRREPRAPRLPQFVFACLTQFVSSADLYANFKDWAVLHAPKSKLAFKAFSNRLACLARDHPDLLKHAHSNKIYGYRLLRRLAGI